MTIREKEIIRSKPNCWAGLRQVGAECRREGTVLCAANRKQEMGGPSCGNSDESPVGAPRFNMEANLLPTPHPAPSVEVGSFHCYG